MENSQKLSPKINSDRRNQRNVWKDGSFFNSNFKHIEKFTL